MTVYPRRRAHIVPGHPRRLRRHRPEEDPMKMLTATMKCGRTVYEARLPIPANAMKDPAAARRIKTQLRLMLAEQIAKGARVTFAVERVEAGSLAVKSRRNV